MRNLITAWLDLHYLDDLARQNSVVHRLHPVGKLLVSLAFAVTTTSFGKYEIAGLLPLFFYPVAIIALGRLSGRWLLSPLLLVAPAVLLIGAFNPVFDRTPHNVAGLFVIAGGWLSFLSLTLKLALTTTAALLLVATTSLPAIGAALRQLGLPRPLVVQLLLLYRYLFVLLEEAGRITQAHALRAASGQGVSYRAWGSLLGQLLLRTVARAERIYQAMCCRGFDGEIRLLAPRPLQAIDFWHLSAWCSFFIACRLFDLPQLVGYFLLEVL